VQERSLTVFIWIWFVALFAANVALLLTLPDPVGRALLHIERLPVAPTLGPMEGLAVWLGDTLAALPALAAYMWRNRLRSIASASKQNH